MNGLTQCPSFGNIYFKNQEAIDNFAADYPNCTHIVGYLLIDDKLGYTITNLDGLSQITKVDGDLFIRNNQSLNHLTGLHNIVSCGSLRIEDNVVLENISALNTLSINNDIKIIGNPSLVTLMGFPEISNIQRDLVIQENESLLNLDGLDNIETIQSKLTIEENDKLIDLQGLSNLTHVLEDLSLNNLEDLETLNGLENLTTVGGIFLIKDIPNLTNLDGLKELTTVGELLQINANPLLERLFNTEQLTTLGFLRISFNSGLKNIKGFYNITEMDGLYIQGNELLASLSTFENVMTIGSISIINNPQLINLNGLGSLTAIDGNIRIYENNALESLAGLADVPIDEIDQMSIHSNPLLNVCNIPMVCRYLSMEESSNIYDNGPDCSEAVEILNLCEAYTKFTSTVFYDLNQNQIREPNEPAHPDFSLNLSPVNINLYPNLLTGAIDYFIEEGDYVLNMINPQEDLWEMTTTPSSYSFSVSPTGGLYTTFDFGIFPKAEYPEFITSINAPNFRCGTYITMEVHAKNIGTTITDGTVWLDKDPQIGGAIYIDTPDIVEVDRYGWHFENLAPGNLITKKIKILIPSSIGSNLHFESWATFLYDGESYTSRYFEYENTIRCSYDPNDKLVHPNRPDNYTLFEEDLIYTIRFQNTGNDVAYDVEIRDTLDPNLDITTFRLLSSSHGEFLNTTLAENRHLTFSFKDINLPDSTSNFDGSQGYVSYLISPNEDLEEETPIHNSAGIYFDQNPPVLTNTTESLMVSMLPTTSTAELENNEVSIFPNPTIGKVVVTTEYDQRSELQLLDYTGKILLEKHFTGTLICNLALYPKGIYMINIKNENQVYSRKIIKI